MEPPRPTTYVFSCGDLDGVGGASSATIMDDDLPRRGNEIFIETGSQAFDEAFDSAEMATRKDEIGKRSRPPPPPPPRGEASSRTSRAGIGGVPDEEGDKHPMPEEGGGSGGARSGGGETVRVVVHEVLSEDFGLFTWPSGVVMACLVWARRREFASASVVEIGAGTALPGLLAAKLGARVVLTDREEAPWVLENMRGAVAANGITLVPNSTAAATAIAASSRCAAAGGAIVCADQQDEDVPSMSTADRNAADNLHHHPPQPPPSSDPTPPPQVGNATTDQEPRVKSTAAKKNETPGRDNLCGGDDGGSSTSVDMAYMNGVRVGVNRAPAAVGGGGGGDNGKDGAGTCSVVGLSWGRITPSAVKLATESPRPQFILGADVLYSSEHFDGVLATAFLFLSASPAMCAGSAICGFVGGATATVKSGPPNGGSDGFGRESYSADDAACSYYRCCSCCVAGSACGGGGDGASPAPDDALEQDACCEKGHAHHGSSGGSSPSSSSVRGGSGSGGGGALGVKERRRPDQHCCCANKGVFSRPTNSTSSSGVSMGSRPTNSASSSGVPTGSRHSNNTSSSSGVSFPPVAGNAHKSSSSSSSSGGGSSSSGSVSGGGRRGNGCVFFTAYHERSARRSLRPLLRKWGMTARVLHDAPRRVLPSALWETGRYDSVAILEITLV